MGHDHDTERPQWGSCGLVLPGTYTAELVRHISPQRRQKCLSSTGSNLTQISMQSILRDPSIADRADPVDRVPDPSTSSTHTNPTRHSFDSQMSDLTGPLTPQPELQPEDIPVIPGSYFDNHSVSTEPVVTSQSTISSRRLPKLRIATSSIASVHSDDAMSRLHEIPSDPSSPHSFTFVESPSSSADIIELSFNHSSKSSDSSCYSSEVSIHDEMVDLDMYETHHCTTTRTVIRPSFPAPAPFFGVLPISFTKPSILGRHRAGHLNPFDAVTSKVVNSFERDLDARQIQWERERAGAGTIQVYVKEERETFQEESWRALVQEMCYGTRPAIGPIPVLGYQRSTSRQEL